MLPLTIDHLLSIAETAGIAVELVAPGVPMATVQAAADAIGVPTSSIVKSVLFVAKDGRVVLAVAAGTTRIDRDRLAAAAGLPRLTLAAPDLVLRTTGFPAGGVPPFGHRSRLPVVVDVQAAAMPAVYGGAGTADTLIRIAPADILRITGGIVAAITAAGDTAGSTP